MFGALWKTPRKCKALRRRPDCRPALESLEVRIVPATPPDCGPLPALVAHDLTLQDTQNHRISVAGPGVLLNATSAWNTPLTAELQQGPAHGRLSFRPDGSFDYTPNLDFTGVDQFSYVARQFYHDQFDLISDAATMTIDVNPAYHANPDLYHGEQDVVLNVPASGGVLVNDRLGTESPPPHTVAVLVDGQGPKNGQVTLNPDGSFAYTPNPFFFGTDTFQYQDAPATEGPAPPADPPGLHITRTPANGVVDSPIATVTITVRPFVPLAPGFFFFVQQDTPLVVTADQGLLSDTTYGPNNGRLTTVVSSAPANGTLDLNPDGSFTYTPNPGYVGNDSFQYQVFDSTTGQLSGPGLVSLFVYAPPQSFPAPPGQPPIANNDSYQVNENNTLNVPPAGVLANDVLLPPNQATAYAFVEAYPQFGTLNPNIDGSFSYTPSKNFTGLDTFTYRVWEWDGTNWTFSNAATVNITVVPFNFPPVANDDFYTLEAGNTFQVLPGKGVLTNDTDFENEPLTAVLVQGPKNGTVTLRPDGSFDYTPTSLSFRGDDTFTYQARDAHGDGNVATVHLHVKGQRAVPIIMPPPVANPDVYTTRKDVPLTVAAADGVLVNDYDADHEAMQAQLIVGPVHGRVALNPDGSFVYVPDAGYEGLDIFTYRDLDDCGDSNVTTISIRVVPPAPRESVAASESGSAMHSVAPTLSPSPSPTLPPSRPVTPTPPLVASPTPTSTLVSPQTPTPPNPLVPDSVALLNRGALDLALFAPDTPQVGPSPQQRPPLEAGPLLDAPQVGSLLARLVGGSSTYGEVSGRLFLDLNGTGINDPLKPGLPGRLVFLDPNNNGVHDEGEPVEITNAKGEYIFRNVPPGKYYVRRLAVEEMTQTAPADDDGYEVRLPPGRVKLFTELDFGLQPPPSGTTRPAGGARKAAPEQPPDESPEDSAPDDGDGDGGDGGEE
jgi:hypothetical protein